MLVLVLLAVLAIFLIKRSRGRSTVPEDERQDEQNGTDGTSPPIRQERVEYEDYHTYAEVGDLRDGGALYGHPTIEERELMEREGSIANPGGVQVGGTGV